MEKLYPLNLLEFERWFESERKCLEYLARLRWPTDKRVCTFCGGSKLSLTGLNLRCRKCWKYQSVLSGTVFSETRLPLMIWFRAAWLLCSSKRGVSALELQSNLGIRTYDTALYLLHKLRNAMVIASREPLYGKVEVDETFIGARITFKPGQSAKSLKTKVIIAAECRGKGIGRIRMEQIPDVKRATLHRFIERNIEQGSTVLTDGHTAYWELEGYQHQPDNIAHQFGISGALAKKLRGDALAEKMPRVHRVAGLLKTWLLGTHHGGISSKHLSLYLDEFVFRFNRRTSASRGLLFYRLLSNCAFSKPQKKASLKAKATTHSGLVIKVDR